MFQRAPLLLLALAGVACQSRVPSGGSLLANREFEIKNGASEAVCEVDVLNIQKQKPDDVRVVKLDIAAGATETHRIEVAGDQDRKFLFKACDGKVLKEWAIQFQPSKAHVDIP